MVGRRSRGMRVRPSRAAGRAALAAALALAAVVGAAAGAEPPTPSARGARAQESHAARFVAALAAVRGGGDDAARATLRSAAASYAAETGRDDAIEVAAYYAALDAEALAEGLALEARYDDLRRDAADGDLGPEDARLVALHRDARAAEDVVPAAHAASLRARLVVRALEDGADARGADVGAARDLALEAVRGFTRAGQRTPTLEARWVLARAALLADDLRAADAEFRGLAGLARDLGRDRWRERGLVGAIGVARVRGDAHAAADLIRALASFRSPDASWALAREVAVQLVSEDRADAARRWLDAHPPTEVDPEIDPGVAAAEWRSLGAAAELRRGAVGRAEALLVDVPGDDATLMRAAVALELGAPERALALLDGLGRTRRDGIDALALEGRARIEAGDRNRGALVLQRALDMALDRDGASEGGWLRASALGECLGLSAVLDLAEARLASDGPLAAAATVEGAVAGVPARVARARLTALASATDLGAVTWIVAADRTLAVHVAPDGTAVAHRIALGRIAVQRGARRLADAALASRAGAWSGADEELAREVASALLPPRLLDLLDGGAGGSLALLPHGAAEAVPFELLRAGGAPLGVSVALWVLPRLDDEAELAPPLDGRAARWVALGAPDLSGTDLEALPGARAELARLADAHPRVDAVSSGAEMSRAALARALSGDRPVHVATHVVDAPPRAGLPTRGVVCAGGEIVTAADVAALRPKLPLVVLGACGSAEGALVDAVGLRGVAQAMLDSGTRAAVVTQWSVSDEHAGRALLAFHAALLGGADPAEALRRARAALRRSGAPPAEWAALRMLGRP